MKSVFFVVFSLFAAFTLAHRKGRKTADGVCFVKPKFECVYENDDGSATVSYGYRAWCPRWLRDQPDHIEVPIGKRNRFINTDVFDRGQPTSFPIGRFREAFTFTLSADEYAKLQKRGWRSWKHKIMWNIGGFISKIHPKHQCEEEPNQPAPEECPESCENDVCCPAGYSFNTESCNCELKENGCAEALSDTQTVCESTEEIANNIFSGIYDAETCDCKKGVAINIITRFDISERGATGIETLLANPEIVKDLTQKIADNINAAFGPDNCIDDDLSSAVDYVCMVSQIDPSEISINILSTDTDSEASDARLQVLMDIVITIEQKFTSEVDPQSDLEDRQTVLEIFQRANVFAEFIEALETANGSGDKEDLFNLEYAAYLFSLQGAAMDPAFLNHKEDAPIASTTKIFGVRSVYATVGAVILAAIVVGTVVGIMIFKKRKDNSEEFEVEVNEQWQKSQKRGPKSKASGV